jgi:precorrin-6A/cobalt-precorrin-6A reductase
VKVLLLGGTAEARELAHLLVDDGVEVVSSLAGRVSRPRLPVGSVRVGGFGGAEGLARALPGFDAVVDATHPFAARISSSAAKACPAAGVPLLRLERPGFAESPGDRWTRVANLEEAATLLRSRPGRVFLTTGRQGLRAFARVRECWFLVRCVEQPDPPLPPRHELILDRGPYTLSNELELVHRHRIDIVVTKDSGGHMTNAKLDAARMRGLSVIVVERPPRPEVETVTTVEEAISWTRAAAGTSP